MNPKRVLRILRLAACLALCLAFLPPAGAEPALRIREAAAAGSDAVWDLVSARPDGAATRDGYAGLVIWQQDGPSFPVEYAEAGWMMNIYTIKMQETAGTGFTLERILMYEISPGGECRENDITPYILADGPVRIDPYGSFTFTTGCPADGSPRYEIAAAAGTDANGHELEFYGVSQRLNILPAEVPENPDYDTVNLRYEADYETEVAEGVWWVPARALGGSRYTNREIAGMAADAPEEKQAEISTLYEALQLFQISGFSTTADNVRIMEGAVNWEHHKPGFDAVRTNKGCCASAASWLSYILSGDYERMGFLSYTWPDGNGHVINYIYHGGYYYFIDMTLFQAGCESRMPESGKLAEYRYAGSVSAYVHRAVSPEAFVQYAAAGLGNPPRFFIHEAEEIIPGDTRKVDGQMTVIIPEGTGTRVIDGPDPERVDVKFVPGPEKTPKWEVMKTAEIRPDSRYLTDGEDAAAEPLTAYRPGDVLTVEYRGPETPAVIDGTEYGIGDTAEAAFCFEENLLLHGQHWYGDYDLRLIRAEHGEALESADSLALGELVTDIGAWVPETQIVVCVRDGDRLTVREVLDGKHYDARKVSITRGADGAWAEPPEIWYLIITKDGAGTAGHLYGRFRCMISDE